MTKNKKKASGPYYVGPLALTLGQALGLLTTLFLLILVIYFGYISGAFLWTGRSGVIQAPQSAYLASEPAVSVDLIVIQDKKIKFTDPWQFRLLKPRRQLSGIDQLVLSNSNTGSIALDVFFDLSSNNKIGLKNIIVWQTGRQHGGSWYDGAGETCSHPLQGPAVIARTEHFNAVSASFDLKNYAQGPKRLVLNTLLSIESSKLPPSPHYICKDGQAVVNEGPPITIQINNLKFNIDSEVRYTWSNKAGKSFEL